MEFGKHIGKGLWGLAGRGLPSVYGIGIIVFVIRSFPPVEFGVYTLLQTILMLVIGTAQTFALQPLVKFGAETDEISGPVTASAILYALFTLPAALLLLVFAGTLGDWFRSGTAGDLIWYISLMLVVSFPRNLASYLLQSKLKLKMLFFLDAIYSLGSLGLIAWLVTDGTLSTAEGLMQVNLLMIGLSSLFGAVVLVKTYAVRPSWSRSMLARTWEYGRYSLGASVSYTLYMQSDNLIISAMMGPVSVAMYNAAKVFTRIYDLMHQLIGMLLIPVFSRTTHADRTDDRRILIEKSLFFFSLILAALSLTLLLAGPFLMRLIYGDKYAEAIPVLMILSGAGFFIPVVAVGASLLHGLGEVRLLFFIGIVMLVLGVGLIFSGASLGGIEGAAYGILLTFVLTTPVWYVAVLRRMEPRLRIKDIVGRYTDIIDFLSRSLRSS